MHILNKLLKDKVLKVDLILRQRWVGNACLLRERTQCPFQKQTNTHCLWLVL